jgi:biopolymer transport protein TolR
MAGFRNPDDNSGLPVAEINITPLVDVMLVLLVIFMVTAPMMESGIPIQLPKASAKALPKSEPPLTLNLTKETRVYLNKEEIPFSQLKAKVQAYFKHKSKKEIFIRADGALPYAFVAQAMAQVKLAGVDRIGLVTLPPDGEPAPK